MYAAGNYGFSSQAFITPTSIFFRHSDTHRFDLRGGPWPARFALAASIVLVGNQFPMPCQQCVRSGDTCNSVQDAAAQLFGSNSKTAALIIGEAQLLVSNLLAENAIYSVSYSMQRCWCSPSHPAKQVMTKVSGFRAVGKESYHLANCWLRFYGLRFQAFEFLDPSV